jgi:hypothetical protein
MMLEVVKLDERIIERRPWRGLVLCDDHTGHALASVGAQTLNKGGREDQVMDPAGSGDPATARGSHNLIVTRAIHLLPLKAC